jgi:hypothetical protein
MIFWQHDSMGMVTRGRGVAVCVAQEVIYG